MGLLDGYATADEYIAATGQKGNEDAVLATQLVGVSRLLERSLQLAPGMFNAHHGTYVFDGNGRSLLRLRGTDSMQYLLRTIDADCLKLDTDFDGDFDDESMDLDDVWLRGMPENAAALSEPFTALQLRSVSTAPRIVFPLFAGIVQIAGNWGWAAVPDTIKQLVIHRTQELREGLKGGALETLPDFEGGMPMTPQTFWYWNEAKRLYGYKLPGFA